MGLKGGKRPKAKPKRLLIVYSLWSLELLREECDCAPWAITGPQTPRVEFQTFELLAWTA